MQLPRSFLVAFVVLTLVASPWLLQLVRFALGSDLYSHIVLIPAVTVGLIWMRRRTSPSPEGRSTGAALICGALAAASLAYAFLAHPSPVLEPHHRLTWVIAGYVLAVAAAGFWSLGGRFMRAHAAAIGFLVFMIPMPGWLERATEIALQHASAEATHVLFALANIPFLRDGQVFRLPSITMEIAQECSGIHSSLVLFITSIVAGQMFLRPGWPRWVLTLAVIPLAIVRNGFRVFTLGVLCEEIGPHMIHHWIHHRGGPVFFALSLIPFFLLLLVLARVGRRKGPQDNGTTGQRTTGPLDQGEKGLQDHGTTGPLDQGTTGPRVVG